MITITDNRTHIMQMRDDFRIKEVKKPDLVDFRVDTSNEVSKIIFKIKNGDKVIMYFGIMEQLNDAVAKLIKITDRMGI